MFPVETTIYSRAYLQSLPELKRQQEIQKYLAKIVTIIQSNVVTSANEGKTSHVHDMRRYGIPSIPKYFPTNEQIIEVLKEKFPDCDVEYVEVKLSNGTIAESGFKISWS